MKCLKAIDVTEKNVLVRLDLDVPIRDGQIIDDARLRDSLPTVQHLLRQQAHVTVIGHLGRPGGTRVEALSVASIQTWFTRQHPGIKVLENLRFDPGEEENRESFARDVVRRVAADYYVFDAFAVSHRRHASIVSIPTLLPTVIGFHMEEELQHLDTVLDAPKRPLVIILGGAKVETKLPLIPLLTNLADVVLIGGTLPSVIRRGAMPVGRAAIDIAGLTSDGLDIDALSAARFAQVIATAGTVVWNGPVGAYERAAFNIDESIEEQLRRTSAWGTWIIAKAISATPAYTVVGGGDTEAALSRLGLTSGIDWVSSGGGAMLHYFAYRSLPFLEALKETVTP